MVSAKHLELSESSLEKLRKLRNSKTFSNMFQTTLQAQINYFSDKTKTLLQDKNIFLDYVQALHLPKFEVMPEGEQSTFGTSAETRRTVSLAMVKEEECSNLSLLFGVRKHRRSDEKQPKARGERFSFSSMRPPQWLKGGGGEGRKRGESWKKRKKGMNKN